MTRNALSVEVTNWEWMVAHSEATSVTQQADSSRGRQSANLDPLWPSDWSTYSLSGSLLRPNGGTRFFGLSSANRPWDCFNGLVRFPASHRSTVQKGIHMIRNGDTVIGLLRTRPDLRRDFGLGFGMLALGLCFHSWVDSFLIVKMSRSMTPTEAANLGGLLAGAVAFAVGVVLGWIGGGWLIESRSRTQAADCRVERRPILRSLEAWFDRYPASRGLLLGGLAMGVGVALGFWALLGGLMMIVAISLGYWGRAIALRQ